MIDAKEEAKSLRTGKASGCASGYLSRFASVLLVVAILPAGCGGPTVSTTAELETFRQADPVDLPMDIEQPVVNGQSSGTYRLVPGDVLELQMPAIVRSLPNRKGDDTEPYRCRIDSAGSVVLPIIGEVSVGGKTLAEAEQACISLYYPRYVVRKPSVVATVAVHRMSRVSVVGAVEKPGVHELRSDEMTLVSALMKAGGTTENGATSICIHRGDGQVEIESIPVIAMNIPARDVVLQDGDVLVVEASQPEVITVVGLVNKPGLLKCETNAKYSIMDALAYAGGVNELADPEYVKVYRQTVEGQVVSATLKLDDPYSVGATDLYLKPGDVVAVEQTAATRTRLILAQFVRMGLGVNAGASMGP